MLKLNYDEISPFTGELVVLVEYDNTVNDTVKICMRTGYQTYLKTWTIFNSDYLAEYEAQLPYNIRDSKYCDESGNVWYKTVLQSPSALLFPDPDDSGKDRWCVMPLVTLPTGNDPNSLVAIGVPINSEGDMDTKYMDYTNVQYFSSNDFEPALFAFQSAITSAKNKREN